MGVGFRIKEILRDKHMTIKELAEKSSISLNTLYSITKRDSERVDNIILQKIANALEVPTYELLSDTDFKKQYNQAVENTTKLLMTSLPPKKTGEIFFFFLNAVGYDAFIDTTRYSLLKKDQGYDTKVWIIEDRNNGLCYTATTKEVNSLKDSVISFLKFQTTELIKNLEEVDRSKAGDYGSEEDSKDKDSNPQKAQN